MDISTAVKEELSLKTTEVQTLQIDKTLLNEKITALSGQISDLEEKLRKKQEEYEEAVDDKEEKNQLKKIRDNLQDSNTELRKLVINLDEQCEKYRVRALGEIVYQQV